MLGKTMFLIEKSKEILPIQKRIHKTRPRLVADFFLVKSVEGCALIVILNSGHYLLFILKHHFIHK
jgi:hypothetical protein